MTAEPIEVEVVERQIRLLRAPEEAVISLDLLGHLRVRGNRVFVGEPVGNEHIYLVTGLTDDRAALTVRLLERPLP